MIMRIEIGWGVCSMYIAHLCKNNLTVIQHAGSTYNEHLKNTNSIRSNSELPSTILLYLYWCRVERQTSKRLYRKVLVYLSGWRSQGTLDTTDKAKFLTDTMRVFLKTAHIRMLKTIKPLVFAFKARIICKLSFLNTSIPLLNARIIYHQCTLPLRAKKKIP